MKKTTKLISLLLAVVMLLALCACGKTAEEPAAPAAEPAAPAEEPAAPAEETPAEEPAAPAEEAPAAEEPADLGLVTAGKLTVATSPDFAPYEFYAIDENGEAVLAGFDVALAQYIADYLGLELEVIPMDFDGILAELANKNVDLGMSGFSPKPEREAAMDFSDFYYMGGQSFVTTTANKDVITSMEAANDPQYSIAAQNGSIQLDLANEICPEGVFIALTKVTDIIAELVGGKLDGAFIETAVAECYAKNYPDLVIVCGVPYDQEGSVVGVSKGNEALMAAVNEAIAVVLNDGTMDQFIADANELATGEIYEGLLENKEG